MSVNKNVLKMNDEQTMNFIDCYKKEEVLWNTKLQAYRNRDARYEAVKRIVSTMNIEGFGPDHVISKFKNLRSSYCQELKKIVTSEKSKTFVEDIYVPHVVWFTKMNAFLKPYVTMRDTCSNYVILNENNSNDIEKTDRENQTMNELNENSQVQASNYEAKLNLTKPVSNNSAFSNTNSTTIKKKEFRSLQKRNWNLKNRKLETLRSSLSETDTVLTAVKQLDSIAEKAQKSKKEDSFNQFGKYIASVLRDLPLKKACLLQQQITNMVMNEIINNDNQNAILEQQKFSSLQTSTNTSDSSEVLF